MNHSRLANEVINQAVRDLVTARPLTQQSIGPRWGSRGRQRNVASAEAFLLQENEDLAFWCALGGLNWHVVIKKSRQLVSLPNRGGRLPVRRPIHDAAEDHR